MLDYLTNHEIMVVSAVVTASVLFGLFGLILAFLARRYRIRREQDLRDMMAWLEQRMDPTTHQEALDAVAARVTNLEVEREGRRSAEQLATMKEAAKDKDIQRALEQEVLTHRIELWSRHEAHRH